MPRVKPRLQEVSGFKLLKVGEIVSSISIWKVLLFSTSSVTIPEPFPVSSTTASNEKFRGTELGIVKVMVPFSLPPIGIMF